jgi:hypothetical protein
LAGTVPTTGDEFRVMPIALSDDQLSVVFQHAEKLSPADRGHYLHRATALLPDVEAQMAPVLRGTDAKSAAAAFVMETRAAKVVAAKKARQTNASRRPGAMRNDDAGTKERRADLNPQSRSTRA